MSPSPPWSDDPQASPHLHFERLAASYDAARPPYPAALFDQLLTEGVVGPGIRVLEVGASSGEATGELLARGCQVVAVDLGVALPRLHAALRERGLLAVWRTVFGDPRVQTEFRRRVLDIVARREEGIRDENVLDPPPTVPQLTAGGLFRHRGSWQWPWQVDLDPGQVRRLFETFSDWRPDEVDAARAAAAEVGPVVREHYVTILHVLQRS